jgi:hypothetical protein
VGPEGQLAGKEEEEGKSHQPEKEEEGRRCGVTGGRTGVRRKKIGEVARST